ncbi:MAG: hypothetical protein HOM68_07980 [Gemmatimonadetes bacterium]|nr:hypothetical protein [Gemmatimonadota bacterium]MBT4613055.1 hypothetical protein [Gemmatimonadota bacterium]MBT5056464.1 hypothetical protein [Gemmatimonadota bacterium]MBT5144171.1 hypothetical protein [Gemmatimonadota bacterium]MBT5586643.1 hypothetical protein [Gemmatimonadota bacterium]
MAEWDNGDWLAATQSGLWLGRPGAMWRGSGPYEHSLNSLTRFADGIVAGADGGLWLITRGGPRWRQLHDEVLTLVEAVSMTSDELQSLVVATGYGVHLPTVTEQDVLCWSNCSEALSAPSARYSTALHLLDSETWLVGTETGLFVCAEHGHRWSATSIAQVAVRALLSTDEGVWAGTDNGDIWFAADGLAWQHHSRLATAESALNESVLALATNHHGTLLAGTTGGIVVSDGDRWRSTGPTLPMAAVAVDTRSPSTWVAGASPGGLWWTEDGDAWQQAAEAPKSIRHLLPPDQVQ